MSTALDAATRVLSEAGEPLHYKEIARRALEKGYWKTDGKTPAATVNAQLVVHVKKHGERARFRHVGRGMFALAEGQTAEKPSAPAPAPQNTVSFTDAAEQVLDRFGNNRPMHYRDIAAKALKLGLIATAGRTPEATMYSSILQERQRRVRRAEQPRFQMQGKGLVALARWLPVGIPLQIDQHNRAVRKKLHEQLRGLVPGDFEALIGRLLAELGFEEVTVTGRSGDGGIDVRGTLVVGDAVRMRMAVQAKRWKQNVQSPVIQQVRGSLGAHEQGLIITTSDFSPGARQEAARPDAIPVGLMNSDQLISLLVEYGIGVRKAHYDLLELGEATPDGEQD